MYDNVDASRSMAIKVVVARLDQKSIAMYLCTVCCTITRLFIT